MSHSHKTKIVDWKFDEAHNFVPSLYGCTECSDTFATLPLDEAEIEHSHKEYTDGCFACKVKTLELSVGDAHSAAGMASKKWDAENQAYRDAVAQGVEPSGVSMHDIEASLKASEILGAPYDAGTMLPPEKITPRKAEIMKAIGDI